MKTFYLLIFFIILFGVSCEKAEPEVPKSSAKEISSPSIPIPNATLSFDSGSNTYTYTVSANTNIKDIAFNFSLPAGATSVPTPGSVQDFTNPVKYTITAEDGSKSVMTVVIKLNSPILSSKCLVQESGSILNGKTLGVSRHVFNEKKQLVYYERFLETLKVTFNLEYYLDAPDLLRIKTYRYNDQRIEERYEYNSDKNLASKIIITNKNGIQTSRQEQFYRYDSQKRIDNIEIRFAFPSLKYGSSVIYEYTNGILTKVNSSTSDVTVDSKGNITKIQFKGQPSNYTYRYNEKGEMTEMKLYNNQGELFSIRRYEYSPLVFIADFYERLPNQESYGFYNLSAEDNLVNNLISKETFLDVKKDGSEIPDLTTTYVYEEKNGQIVSKTSNQTSFSNNVETQRKFVEYFTLVCDK